MATKTITKDLEPSNTLTVLNSLKGILAEQDLQELFGSQLKPIEMNTRIIRFASLYESFR